VGSNGLIQSAAINAARFDHDSAGVCRGLLIEEGRENFISFSEAFNDASWGKASTGIAAPVVTANQGTAPDGQNTADRIVFAASTASAQEGHVWKVASGGTKAGGSSVTASVWLRTETGTATVYLSITEGATGGTFTACSVTTTWTRFTVTRTLTATALVYMEIGPDTRALGANQPTASGATALVWGAQLEAGSFPTSYIPTTTGSLARSADVCSITGGDFNNFYNQSEGTFLSSTQLFSVGNDYSARYWNVSDPPNYMRVSVFGQTSTQESSYLQNNDGTLNSTVASELSRISRTAGAYQLNNARIVKNGTLGVLDTTFTPYTSFNNLGIMTSASGTIAALRYYKKRLPDAKLVTLTT
jgi:hypothetical protein